VIALKVLSEIAERLGDPIGARGWVDRLLKVDLMNEKAQLMVGQLSDVGAAISKPSFERPSWAELKVPEAEPEAPAAAEEEFSPPSAEPEPVVTQTMAEVYVKQGLLDSALKVYRELLAQRPEDPELLSRIAELESRAPAPGDAPVDSEKHPYLASETGGMSARAFLAAVIAAGELGDTPSPGPLPKASTPLQSAFDTSDGSEIPGALTHPAPDRAFLSSVFGEEGGVSFDEFFGGTAPKQETTEGSEPSGAGGGKTTEVERDDDDFQDWLKGLKS